MRERVASWLFGALGSVGVALAAPAPAVVWYRASESCPDGSAFLAQTGDDPRRFRLAVAGDHIDFVVTITAQDGEVVGRLERQTQAGTVAIRELRDRECSRVAEACPSCPSGSSCSLHGDCESGVCRAGLCHEATCDDAVLNGSETDVDCGGNFCLPCAPGQKCVTAEDCADLVCANGVCQAGSCTDGVANATETDVDCGGPDCPGCPLGTLCTSGDDCATGACDGGICVSCSDGIRNGSETDVDCGGGVCPACEVALGCAADADCASGCCSTDTLHPACYEAHCCDGIQNGGESDVDCGGPQCPALCENDGDACVTAADCSGSFCREGLCYPDCGFPHCCDGTLNGGESDVDCGGAECRPCSSGKLCALATDCLDGVCTAGVCQTGTCSDGVANFYETDTDCGGPMCPACPAGARCSSDDDCESGTCQEAMCR